MAGEILTKAKKWWRGGVIYQIYPRSFQDSNADGCGDINGIRRRLDYIAALGVDAIWISPFFKSPMFDFGYDVSDYKQVDSLFGTLDDFDKLIKAAHGRDLKIMIDLVISHTSDQHRWFVQSKQDKTNAKADWYVWADAKPDGGPPNNWLSIFGGSAWQWHTQRCQYYLHNFLTTQPDLNFHNLAMQDAVLSVADFWLQRGVDGFRLDTVNFYFHDQQLRDNPPLAIDARNAVIAPRVNPYNFQDHIYDRNRPENLQFLQRLRSVIDNYSNRAALGEIGDALHGLDLIAEYTKGNSRLHMCYGFDFLSEVKLTPARVRAVISQFNHKAPHSWSCWSFSNHDVERHASRLTGAVNPVDRVAYIQMLAACLMSLSGSIGLYQGEELGLPEAEVAYKDLRDPYGIAFWPEFKGRDGCRTPMPWSSYALYGGFSDVPPWLPIAPVHTALAVDVQKCDKASVLAFYRAVLDLRRRYTALRLGRLQFIGTDLDILLFLRVVNAGDSAEKIICAFNFSSASRYVKLSTSVMPLGDGALNKAQVINGGLTLPAYGIFWGMYQKG